MQALHDFHRELVELYAYEVETTSAFHKWAQFLQQVLSASKATTLDSPFFVWRGDRNSPDQTYQYVRPFKEIIKASEEGGRNVRLHRNGVLALTYALWEVEYRLRIARECGFRSKNDIKSDLFQDLNKYRQAVLHVSGQLDREPKVIQFFRKGDIVSLTKDHMYQLFSHLTCELNRIGEEYYSVSLGLSMDEPFPKL